MKKLLAIMLAAVMALSIAGLRGPRRTGDRHR